MFDAYRRPGLFSVHILAPEFRPLSRRRPARESEVAPKNLRQAPANRKRGEHVTLSSTEAAILHGSAAGVGAATAVLAHLKAFTDLAAAEPLWRALEREAAFPVYQRFDFLALWQRHIGAPAGIEPFIIVGFDGAGRPVMLWPLGRRRIGPLPLHIAEPLGGKHVNYNFGLWRRSFAESLDAAAVAGLIGRIRRLGTRLDLISIERQPENWDDVPNPLRLLPHQPSPSFGWRGRLDPDPAAYFARMMSSDTRLKFRRKERKLAQNPGYRYVCATTPAEVERTLDAYFVQKAARLRDAGIANVFAEPGVEAFLRAAAYHGLDERRPLLECHALVCDDEVIAVFTTLRDDTRVSGMLMSITGSDNARWSPGVVLLIQLVTRYCEAGLPWFDLGVGEASYKTYFCAEAEPLFTSFIPLTLPGRLLAAGRAGLNAIKRRIKQSPWLWTMVQASRRRLFGTTKPAATS
ncbi:MAG: GNAT family N-acetyltransferase [Blastochloris sp.]|nr:GNAT family N-acetyltransferase [Blastochloris sp.]